MLRGHGGQRWLAALLPIGLLLISGSARSWPGAVLDRPEEGGRPSPFPVPEELKGAIRFWSDIFLKHESNRVVIHDREHTEIIWQVLVLPTDDEGRVREREADELVRTELDALKERLRRLSRDPVARDQEDEILLALAGGPDTPHLAGAWTRLRAQRGIADHLETGIELAKKYRATIARILAEEGIPAEIAALPFVESGYNPNARSSAGAAGLWQLMPATARELGLKVTRKEDERLDIRKATRAAARLLRKNYEMLGTWPLAITGYNHGSYGVRRAVQSVGSTDLVFLIEHYEKPAWGFASKHFYAEFLAAVQILRTLDRAQEAVPQPVVTAGPQKAPRPSMD